MKTETKHTPGPWQTGCIMTSVEHLPEGWNIPIVIADCHTKNAPETKEERVANARLIVAAPELLEACQLAVESETGEHWFGKALPALKAAIAKAEKSA